MGNSCSIKKDPSKAKSSKPKEKEPALKGINDPRLKSQSKEPKWLSILEEGFSEKNCDIDNEEFLKKLEIEPFEKYRFPRLRLANQRHNMEFWNCFDKERREFVTITYINFKKTDYFKKSNRFNSFVDELNSAKNLLQSRKLGGIYFMNIEGGLEKFIIVELSNSESSSLAEFISVRKKLKAGAAYNCEEALHFLSNFSQILSNLMDTNIYHSDIKPENITYSKSKRSFILENFGTSKIIPVQENLVNGNIEVDVTIFAYAGTIKYCSPEKKYSMGFMRRNLRGLSLPPEHSKFNPFKCDLWSLKVCVEAMIENQEKTGILKEIWPMLDENDWRKRIDGKELERILIKEKKIDPNLFIKDEEDYIKMLEKKKFDFGENWDEFTSYYTFFGDSYLYDEQLKLAKQEYLNRKNKYGDLNVKYFTEYHDVLKRLGDSYLRTGNLKAALDTLQAILPFTDNQHTISKNYHLSLYRMYKGFGNYAKAYYHIQKAFVINNMEKNQDTFSKELIQLMIEKGKFWLALGQKTRAIEIFNESIKIAAAAASQREMELKSQIELIAPSIVNIKEFSLRSYEKDFEALKTVYKTEIHVNIAKLAFFYCVNNYSIEGVNAKTKCLELIRRADDINLKLLTKEHQILKNTAYWKKYLEIEIDIGQDLSTNGIIDFNMKNIKDISPKDTLNLEDSNPILREEVRSKILDLKTSNLNQATEILGDISDNLDISIDFCEKILKLKEFKEEQYQNIDFLGGGSFGQVWRALNIDSHDYVALKYVFMKNSNENEKEKSKENLAGLLRESKILEKLKSIGSEYFCEFEGIFYQKNEKNLVSAFVLITSAGDCSVEDLRKERENVKSNETSDKDIAPYSVNEVMKILFDISEALIILKKNNIYHSDIKPHNIVYSKKLKKYQLIDFGVSMVVESVSKGNCKLEDYGRGGTDYYSSPEKMEFKRLAIKCSNLEKKLDDLEPNPDEGIKNELIAQCDNLNKEIENLDFNPFKCDIYSLGKSILVLISQKALSAKVDIVQNMMLTEWDQRLNAEDIKNFVLNSYPAADLPKINIQEQKFLENIENNRRKGKWKEYYKKFDEAFMPAELFSVVNEELRIFLKENSDKLEGKEEAYAEIKFRRGLALRKNGDLINAEKELEEVLEIQTKFANKDNNIEKQKSDTLLALAAVINERGDHDKTEAKLKEALELRKIIYGSDEHPEVLLILEELAIHKGRIGDNGTAAEELENILQKQIEAFVKDKKFLTFKTIANVLFSLTKQWTYLHQYSRAITHLEYVLLMRTKILGTEMHPQVAEVLEELAKNHSKLTQFDTA